MRKTILFLAALALSVGFLPAARAAVNDPMAPDQYGYTQIQAPSAWTKSTGKGVIIAIVDGGTDLTHEDLHSKIVANCPGTGCHDYGDNDDNPQDDSPAKGSNGAAVKGHGTHVAGLAAAATNNSTGGVGIAPDAQILPLKVFGQNMTAAQDLIGPVTQAVNFAVSHNAKVINLSLEWITLNGLNNTVENSCNAAFQQGVLCVVAAGNSGQANPSGYAHDFNALVVTANDSAGNHTSFGQHADTKWSVSAPGLDNLSTWPMDSGKYKSISGTSMASPQAAGVAALVFAQHPTWTPGQVADQIIQTADPMGDPTVNGAGRVNAARAVGAPSVAPSDPGTRSHRTSNTYGGGSSGSGGSGSSSGSSSGGGGSSASGSSKGTLPPAGGTNDSDFANLGNGNAAIGTRNASKSSKATSNSITGQQVLELVAVVLLAMSALSTLSATRRRRRTLLR